MDAVLGIDPAWTRAHPSGVALLVHARGRWHSCGISPSYEGFYQLGRGIPVDWSQVAHAGAPEVSKLLDGAARLAEGARIRAIAVDMPIARRPFNSRRPADDLASRALSRFGCAVHSPTPERPGDLSRLVSEEFSRRGFEVCTAENATRVEYPLLEVYPHPAAMALLDEDYRVPYKVGKTKTYWPEATIEERVERILDVWERLIVALADRIDRIDIAVPRYRPDLRLAHLKRFEDALDALICGWVATQYLAGNCVPYGDDEAAIWVPRRRDAERSARRPGTLER